MLKHALHVPPQHPAHRLSIINRSPASFIIVLVLFLSLLGTGLPNIGPSRTAAAPIPCGDVAALRNAIVAANSTGGIVELAPGCPYSLVDGPYDGPGPTGFPVITGNVRIWGNGALILRAGGPRFRLFAVAPGGSLSLVDLTIIGGYAQGGAGGNGLASGAGGGGMGSAGGNGGYFYPGTGGGGGGGSASPGASASSLAGGAGGMGVSAGGLGGGNSPSAPGGQGNNGGGGGGSFNQAYGYYGGSGGAGGFGGGGGGGGFSGLYGSPGQGGSGGFGGGGGGSGGVGSAGSSGSPGFGGGLGGRSYVVDGWAGGGGGGAGLGGAVFVRSGGALNIAHSQLLNNWAEGGAGGSTDTGPYYGGSGGGGGSAYGGAIFNMGNLCLVYPSFGGNGVIPGYGGAGRYYGATGSAIGNDYYMYGGATMSCPPGFPGLTVTTASDATTAFSASPQPVTLSATVSAPYGVVDGGTVTFFVYQGGTLVGSPANVTVTNGNASVPYTLPAATPAGTYTIVASYGPIFPLQPSTDSSKVLTITPAATTTAAGNATTTYSLADQPVTLNAAVTSPAGDVNVGNVTFTVKQDATVIGVPVTSGTVTGGAASATFTLPAGTAAGTYSIEAVFNGGSAYQNSSDLLKTLTIDPASTTVAASDATATYSTTDQTVTLSATVISPAGMLNAGTVTFTVRQGATTIGVPAASSVVSGSASVTFTLPGGTPAGSYTIEAAYVDPAGSLVSSSDTTRSLTINAAATSTTAVDSAVTYSSADQPVALSATVTSPAGAVNEGTVTFTITQAGTPIGIPVTSGAVSGGVASAMFTLPGSTSAGTYTIEVTYTDAGGSFLTSTDSSSTLTVIAADTTTVALDVAATYSLADQPVTLGASVASLAGPVDEGTTTFVVSQGGTVIGVPVTSPVSGGSASALFTLPGGTAAGSYAVSATYDSPGGSFLTSTDTTGVLIVNAASTTTNASSAVATFSLSDQSVTLSAAVSSPAGSVDVGTVTFTVKLGGTVVGVPVTSGTVSSGSASATFTLPGGTAVGSYTIEAVYSGAGSLLASADATRTLAVGQAVTATTVTSAPATFSLSDQSVGLSATVISSAGTVNVGMVTFTVSQGGIAIGSSVAALVSGGSASATFTLPGGAPAGVYTIDATYDDPGGSFQSSTGTETLTVSPAATTTTAANAVATFSLSDQPITLNATVTSPSGAVNTGTLTFTVRQGGTVVGVPVTGPVSGGAASAALTLPGGTSAGTYVIEAVYSGSASLLASSDATMVLTVSNATTSTTAASGTATFSLTEQSVTLSATVASPSGPVNAGSVTFTVSQGGTVIGLPVTSPVSGDAASAVFTLPGGTAAGTYAIEAVYNPGGSLDPSSDTTKTLTVGNAATTTNTADATATFDVGDQAITLSATVSSSSGPVNTGSVTFTVSLGGTVVGMPVTSGTVSSSAASATYTLPGGTAVGAYAIQAVYNPGGSLDTSSDTTRTLTVSAPAITVTPSMLPNGTVGSAYNETVGAVGGVGPYTFALTAGTLPSGLTFDAATGVLSGAPLAPGGTFDFTITATDSVSTGGASQAYSVVIGLPVLDIVPPVLADGVVNELYEQRPQGTGGVGPYTFALNGGALPDGLTLDGVTGTIAGRLEKVGSFTFTLAMLDTVTTATASREYVIHVLEGPPPPPPTDRCVDLNFDSESAVRASIPDEFAYALYCRDMVRDGQFVTWLGYPIYHWGNVGDRSLVDMGILQAVDVFSPPDVRDFNDAVVCLRGAGRVFLLKDTFSTDHRSPEEVTAWTTEAYPGFTCATLYSPATVVLVRAEP